MDHMEHPEQVWLAEYRQGRVEALGQLVDHFRRPLYAFISRLMDGHVDADEVFQEVWLRAIKNLDRFDDEKVLSWLFRIAHNLVIDRSRRARPAASLDAPVREDEEPLGQRVAAAGLPPDREASGHDLGTRIAAAVARLPGEQREVFLLRMEGDVPFKDIARMQKVSINTALARMQYALAKLREELKDDYHLVGRNKHEMP
jgi:RNA polymerase sigma-70 factor (ECF subfamily)